MLLGLPDHFPPALWYTIQSVYLVVVFFTLIRILMDTRSVNKSLSYILLVMWLPVIGILFYFFFGVNYRKRKAYKLKLKIQDSSRQKFIQNITEIEKRNETLLHETQNFHALTVLNQSKMMGANWLLPNKKIEILINGNSFYPDLLKEIANAKKHIHIEFYIFEDDKIGQEIGNLLINKAHEGVEIRMIYDDFGSKKLTNKFIKKLKQNNIEIYPFNKIRFILLANRANYRNHRKIVIIDGEIAYTGGINIKDEYYNEKNTKLYWRDTHVKITGYSSQALQLIFLSDWNFCSQQELTINAKYFPDMALNAEYSFPTQVISSGPDSDLPNILYAIIQAINSAQKSIWITTPYYVPDTSLHEAIKIAAMRGVDVQFILPEKGDSKIVDYASQSYWSELLKAGVKIYLYKKGFIHAKTFVVDRQLASIGTANMDLRSFDLNFEVMSLIFHQETANELAKHFEQDLIEATPLNFAIWKKRPFTQKITQKLFRLLSPFL